MLFEIHSREATVVRALCASVLPLMLCGEAFAATSEAARIRAFESSFGPPVSVVGEPQAHWTLSERMAHWKVPGVSVAVIRNGSVAWAKGFGVLQVGKPDLVDTQTVFSVGSVSKVGAAAVTLRLVDAGMLDLDRDVNGYMKRWQVPANPYTLVRPVTLRGILSHSAGFTVHGFGDFQPGATLPNVIDTLEGRAPATHEPVRVVFVPGERFQYSGGGTTVEQLVIEETTGLDFPSAARRYVFEPLGMARSTYVNPLPPEHGNIAKAHGEDGQPRALPRGYEAMPETAASGLWTTPSDYAKLVIAFIQSYRGQADSFLKAATARQMMTEVGRSLVGLGPFLEGEGQDRRFFHGGANDSYRAYMEGHMVTGNGVIIFTNGANGSSLTPEVRRAVAASEGWSPALSDSLRVQRFQLSPAELEEKAGVYRVQPAVLTTSFRNRSEAVAYRVAVKDGGLVLGEDEGERTRPLIAVDASKFVMDSGSGVVHGEFVRDYSGHIGSLILRLSAESAIEAEKVAERAH